jgi:hypothetical protein
MRDEYDHVDTEFGAFAPSNTVSADFARQLERELDSSNTVSATLLTTKCRELAEVTKQRDDLLESLKEVMPYIVGDRCVPWKKAQDAIDRATEGGAQ